MVIATEQDPAELNFEPLKGNLALLREMRDQDGKALRIETLPMPEPVFSMASACLRVMRISTSRTKLF